MRYDPLGDAFSPDSSFGLRTLSAVELVCYCIMLTMVAMLGFVLIDQTGIEPTATAVTIVAGKQVYPAYTSLIAMPAGKSTILLPVYHQASYDLKFEVKGNPLDSAVSEEFFNKVHIGDQIQVTYGRGRLSGSYEVEGIALDRH